MLFELKGVFFTFFFGEFGSGSGGYFFELRGGFEIACGVDLVFPGFVTLEF